MKDHSQDSNSNHIKAISSLGRLKSSIGAVLLLLDKPRKTLAQKAIQEELNTCLNYADTLLAMPGFSDQKNLFDLSLSQYEELDHVCVAFIERLDTFKKAANYSLNYLEQYFEHEFWLNLSEQKFREKLVKIIKQEKL